MVPDGLKFLQLGWWVIHATAIALLYLYAYRRGRRAGRREPRAGEKTGQKEKDATRS